MMTFLKSLFTATRSVPASTHAAMPTEEGMYIAYMRRQAMTHPSNARFERRLFCCR
ncbi:hypothetical protein [Jannaschia sp. LMIT008]|uniref:hypothetical protein n=1 Tax=Jannaschia maritima TaxID=3032585 RepID=UPI00281108C9|nr:hypothetical protein [Jannaschia sp. LMIT008]